MFMKKSLLATMLVAAGLTSMSVPAHAGDEPFLGQIITVGFDFCPNRHLPASGQLLSIQQNTALFSLLGTTYGGDGRTTFGLPNLNGRMPVHVGQGPGLPFYTDGEVFGSTTIQLTAANLPPHSHTAQMRAFSGAGDAARPLRNSLAAAPVGSDIYSSAAPTVAMNTGNINVLPTGSGQAFSNSTPISVIKYCISTSGIFPSRN